jgi:hypothetical protein
VSDRRANAGSPAEWTSDRADGPLFRDPIHDGAADPVVVWNREERAWWMIYTSRRANVAGDGVAWVHGTDLGVASSDDGGATWLYRGVVAGLDPAWGRNTFWAPEVFCHDGQYHMYVSYIRGVPNQWAGHQRHILHHTSPDLLTWTYRSRLSLSSDYVIDACVYPLPDGRFRMWFKDEARGDTRSATYAADSSDLDSWDVAGPVLTHRGHEGPNVFTLGGWHWLIVDEWRGQGVFRSNDLVTWSPNGLILDRPGSRRDDAAIGHHADVVVTGEDAAYIFYFTHPGRNRRLPDPNYAERRSAIHVARLHVNDGVLTCDRDERVTEAFLPLDGPTTNSKRSPP